MGRVLIVDDNFVNQQLLQEMLGEAFTCDVASSGKKAVALFVEALEKAPYDVIILDIAMPEFSGIDVLKEVRGIEKQKNISTESAVRVIMCTAFKEPFVEAYKYGCDDYLMKPVDVIALTVMVTRHVVARQKNRLK
jgi:two-component system, chemotaxis family, chemotaxis protein CheY